MDKKRIKESLELLIEQDMIWLFLGAIISSDNLNSIEDYTDHIHTAEAVLSVVDELDADPAIREKIKEMASDSLRILGDEMTTFKNNRL